jgi:hypothetical protein
MMRLQFTKFDSVAHGHHPSLPVIAICEQSEVTKATTPKISIKHLPLDCLFPCNCYLFCWLTQKKE